MTVLNWAGGYGKDSYFNALKQVFKGGAELRDFLVKNNLVTFELLK